MCYDLRNLTAVDVCSALHGEANAERDVLIRSLARDVKAMELEKSHHGCIGILSELRGISGLAHEFVSTVLSGIQAAAFERGFDVLLLSGIDAGYVERCRERGLDGVAIVCMDSYSPDTLALIQSEIPTVTIDYVFSNCDAILSDNERGISELVDYVYSMGHRRLAYIRGDETTVSSVRFAAFQRACEEHGIELPSERVRFAQFHDTMRSKRVTQELLTLPEPPTCIFYPDDFSYLGGKEAIESMGLSVPRDVSCVGFDGITLTQQITPRLTTCRQNTKEIGETTLRLLCDTIELPDGEHSRRVLVPGELIVGETVAPPRDA